ncbi:MAG: hypothetical protein HYT47_02725 [Candidatus Vogelbacteria bacterium]|nr:hypothetical protein [Candidatus Vogelbacteria bacterium]
MSHLASIKNRWDKIKPWLGPVNFLLLAVLSFGLGRWTKIEEVKEPVRIEQVNLMAQTNQSIPDNQENKTGGQVVGSKNGSKYHYPWCSGAERIKEENKIWFFSAAAAKRAGYAPAANCPGL